MRTTSGHWPSFGNGASTSTRWQLRTPPGDLTRRYVTDNPTFGLSSHARDRHRRGVAEIGSVARLIAERAIAGGKVRWGRVADVAVGQIRAGDGGDACDKKS